MKTSFLLRRMLQNGDNAPILGVSLGINGEHSYLEYAGDKIDPRALRLYDFDQATYLIYWPGHFIPDIFEPNPGELTEPDLLRKLGSTWTMGMGIDDPLSTPGLICSWCYYGFILAVKDNPEFADFLKELYEAFCEGRGRAHVMKLPFGSGGHMLCLFPDVTTIEGTKISGLLDH